MARIEGTQNIPSEWLDIYRSNLLGDHPAGYIRKRYPYRIPRLQEGGSGVSQKQIAQRARFKTARDNFKTLTPTQRQRWFDSEPPWSSFLWYYNYFIMSSLIGNADTSQGGFGVIKSIQTVQMSMPSGSGEGTVAISTIDASKSVVMLWGSSVAEGQVDVYPYAVPVYPYLSGTTDSQVKAKWSVPSPFGDDTKAATISVTVIEYI